MLARRASLKKRHNARSDATHTLETPKDKPKRGTVWSRRTSNGKPPRRWPSVRARYRGKVTWLDRKREDIGVLRAHGGAPDEYVAPVRAIAGSGANALKSIRYGTCMPCARSWCLPALGSATFCKFT